VEHRHPRSNCACTFGSQEVGKVTLPTSRVVRGAVGVARLCKSGGRKENQGQGKQCAGVHRALPKLLMLSGWARPTRRAARCGSSETSLNRGGWRCHRPRNDAKLFFAAVLAYHAAEISSNIGGATAGQRTHRGAGHFARSDKESAPRSTALSRRFCCRAATACPSQDRFIDWFQSVAPYIHAFRGGSS
jgi:hypothetical protein